MQTLLSAFSQAMQLNVAFDQTVGFGEVGQVYGTTHEALPLELLELAEMLELVELVELVPLLHRKYSQADPARPHSAMPTVVQSMASAAGRTMARMRNREWILVIFY